MIINPFQLLFPRKFLGIDIGTSYIKLVEISKFGYRTKLENYGSLSASILYEKSFRTLIPILKRRFEKLGLDR